MRVPLIPISDSLQQAIRKGVLVTHSARQAYELNYSWSYSNVQSGLHAFQSPEIYSFDAWLQRTYEDLISQEILQANRFLVTHSMLRLAFQLCTPDPEYENHALAITRAWRTYIEWNLQRVGPDLETTENGRLFRQWVEQFKTFQESQEIVTLAELPALIVKAVTGKRWCPKAVTFFGLEDISPARQELITQLRQHGCGVEVLQPTLLATKRHHTIKFESSSRERSTLVTWVRQQLSELGANSRIGVIVPDLASSAPRLRRQFEASFYDCDRIDQVVNIGLGLPLRDTRICKDILQFLDWTIRDLGYEEVLQLGRSPYLQELAIPAIFSQESPERMYFHEYVHTTNNKAVHRRLNSILNLCLDTQKLELSAWIDRAISMFEQAGWGSPNNADTKRAQAAFILLFNELNKLSPLLPPIRWTKAVALIRNALRAQTLAVDIRNTPVQVLSREDAAGLVFDALWIAGTSEETWPPKIDLNPMIPISVQRKAHVPKVTQGQILNWAKTVSDNWARAAPTVVFSYVDEEQDNADFFVESSRLLVAHQHIEVATLLSHPELASRDHPWGTMQSDQLLRQYSPERGTAIPSDTTWIRSSTIKDQSRCPFRAWAIHRLDLPDQVTPHRLPNVLDRGTVIHELTEHLLTTAKSRTGISKLGREDVVASVDYVLKKRRGYLPKRFIARERERLIKLIEQWIDFETNRPDFSVVALEKKFSTKVAGLDISLRVDRIDATEDLTCLIIDFKTGAVSPNSWLPPRLLEPQMPLYSVAVPEADGLAYQKIPANGRITMTGFANHEDSNKKLKAVPQDLGSDFFEAKSKWKTMLESTVEEFKQGEARVDPINPKTVCQYCHLMGFCRQFSDITFELETPDPNNDETR